VTSICVPIQLVQLRMKKWDEWILQKIDEYENVDTRYNSVVGTPKARTYIGGTNYCIPNYKIIINFRIVNAVYIPFCRGSYIPG